LLDRGTIIAGYRLDGVLGEGGMGTVYRATQLSLNRVVALKLLAGELSNDPGFRTRFEREGQLQAGLDHQNIVTVYEAGRADQGLFLAMRLIEGPTLKDLIRAGELDSRRTLRILAQVALALDEAHGAGLIHRDIKPQNILIGRADHTFLADFGLIKAPDETSLTGTGQFIGTIDYVAPEQIQGDPATGASDIYALTGVLFECLTGQVPFARPNEAATLHAHVISPPPKVSELRPELPAAIDEVIAAGMAKEPEDRPESATGLVRSAAAVLAGVAARPADAPITPFADGAQRTRASDQLAPRPPAAATVIPGASPAGQVQTPAGEGAPATVLAGAPQTVIAGAPGAGGQAAPATEVPGAAVPAPPGAATRAGGSGAAVALVATLAAAAIVAGFLLGHSGSSKPSAGRFSGTMAAGHLSLRFPARWVPGAAGSQTVPGIVFQDPVSLIGPGGILSAGTVTDASGATLLPATFVRRVPAGGPAPARVRLGALQGLSWAGLHPAGATGTTTVYTIPTDAGVVTIVCNGTTAAFMAECSRAAAGVRLVNARALPVGPLPQYASGLAAAFNRLGSELSNIRAALAAARTPAAQAAAADRASAAYAAAATAIAHLTVSPRDRAAHAALLASIRRLAADYAAAATAARGGHSQAYATASRQLSGARTALTGALQALTKLGYSVNAS
jgi:predicted Ser/Thr protein kinase